MVEAEVGAICPGRPPNKNKVNLGPSKAIATYQVKALGL